MLPEPPGRDASVHRSQPGVWKSSSAGTEEDCGAPSQAAAHGRGGGGSPEYSDPMGFEDESRWELELSGGLPRLGPFGSS